MPSGIAFVPIINTGDLERKGHYSRLVGQIYRQLTLQSALMPQTIAMSLDREDRTDQEKDDIAKTVGGNVQFLPRRTLENYLLHPEAIAEVLGKFDEPGAVAGETIEKIKVWIEEHAADIKYKSNWTGAEPLAQLTWLENVDAPKLLVDLFASMTDHKLEFRKVEHSVALVNWLLVNRPNELNELATYVEGLLLPKH